MKYKKFNFIFHFQRNSDWQYRSNYYAKTWNPFYGVCISTAFSAFSDGKKECRPSENFRRPASE